MEMIVQSIAEEIKVVEIHSPDPNFFRCGSTYFVSGFVAEHNMRFLLLNNRLINYKYRSH